MSSSVVIARPLSAASLRGALAAEKLVRARRQPMTESETTQFLPAASVVTTPRPAPGVLESLLWVIGFLLFSQFIPLIIGAIWSVATTGDIELLMDNVLNFILVGDVLAISMSVAALRWRVGPDWMRAINLRLPALLPCVLALLCMPAVAIMGGAAMKVTEFAFNVQEPSRELVLESNAKYSLWFVALVIAVGAALSEELFCRGFLGRGLVGRYGVLVGVLITSAIFGFIHLNPAQGVFAFVLGIGMHLAYLATRSLWVPILMHFQNNIMVVVALYMAPESANNGWTVELLWYAVPALLVGLVAGCFLFRLRVRDIPSAAVAQEPAIACAE